MIPFEDRQKTKILKSLFDGKQSYVNINKKTGIKIESIRGRMSEMRQAGWVEKDGEKFFKITDTGMRYFDLKEIEVR